MGSEPERSPVRVIIADAGPLIHLWEANCLHLLPLAGTVFTTPQVIAEWLAQRSHLRPAEMPSWLIVAEPSDSARKQASDWITSGELHAGESEALAVAIEEKADWFLSDDTAARAVGEQVGLCVHGTLGVIIWAAKTQFLSEREAHAALDR